VVRVLGYRSGGLCSIPGTIRKKVVGLERGPLSLVSTTEELLDKKSSGSCLENREYGRRDPSRCPRVTIYPQKVGNHFTDKQRSLGRYSSLSESDHGIFFICMMFIRMICMKGDTCISPSARIHFDEITVTLLRHAMRVQINFI
jgi:hypothetical protein